MRALVLTSFAFVLGTGAGGAAHRGVLTGVVMRGPITPVCVAEQPCDAPAPHVTLVFSHGTHVVARVTTSSEGRYRLRLPATTYEVHRASASVFDSKLDPRRVQVKAGRTSRIDFSIDTGIR